MNLEELLDTMQDEMHSAHEEIEKFMNGKNHIYQIWQELFLQ